MQNNPIKGKFDFKHLKMIHQYIFQDIYDWAGKERTVEIGKGNLFCTVNCIPLYAQTVFNQYYEECYQQVYCLLKKVIIQNCHHSQRRHTINALACADSVLIPVQAAYLPVKGLQQLIKTIGRVKKQLNPKLKIEGILLTMVDNRTNYARDISLMVYDTYSASIKVFGTEIPMSVRASEVSVEGGSIYSYDPKGKAAFHLLRVNDHIPIGSKTLPEIRNILEI